MGRERVTLGEVLEMRPVRLAEWEERDGRVVLRRPVPEGRGLRGVLERAAAFLSSPTIKLDDTGTRVWRLMDGSRTVAQIAGELAAAGDLAGDGAAERVALFVHQLARHGMLRFE